MSMDILREIFVLTNLKIIVLPLLSIIHILWNLQQILHGMPFRHCPYLMEYRYDCNEQLFSKLYANGIVSSILTSDPELNDVFYIMEK